MKTPRKILLEQHQAALPKLDALRRETINAELHCNPSSTIMDWPSLLWRELIWPCRGIWVGLATAWLLILAANFSMRDASQPVMARIAPSQETIIAWQQQEQLLTELTGADDLHIALPVRSFSPRPSSQRQFKQYLT